MEQFVHAACANQPALHAASLGVIAVTVAAWFRRTRPIPSCFDIYIGVEDVGSEIAPTHGAEVFLKRSASRRCF